MELKHEIPLLKDHHTHPVIYASLRDCLNISAIPNKQDALLLLAQSKEAITVALGWKSNLYNFTEAELAALPPVVICNLSFHSFLINKPAREILAEEYPAVITNIDDSEWVEKNIFLTLIFIANIKQCNTQLLKSFYDESLLPSGVWYAEDMLLTGEHAINMFRDAGYLDKTNFWADLDTYNSLSAEAQRHVFGIKLFTDGAFGSRTAALKQSYLSGGNGVLIYADEELRALIEQFQQMNKPIAIHAIGDLATEQVIRVLSGIKQSAGCLPQIRIEHCQLISPENAEIAKDLGLSLSMQPNFSQDSIQYQDRLSAAYCKCNNPMRMLIDHAGFIPGEDLFFGSDGMPHGVQGALEQSLFPPFPEQALSLEEFVAGYCLPDKEHGYIEVEINQEHRKVQTKVIPFSDQSGA